MREREEVFDHFITAVINTLNADEIYDAAIEGYPAAGRTFTDDEPEHTPRFFRHP